MPKPTRDDVRNFTKYINQLIKVSQMLLDVLKQKYDNPDYAGPMAHSLIIRAAFLEFLNAENTGRAEQKVPSENFFFIRRQLKNLPGAKSYLLKSAFDSKVKQSFSPEINLAIRRLQRESAQLCAELFKIKGRNILGDIYESLLDNRQKKGSGQYYTPDFVVEYILDKTLAEADVLQNPYLSVLDPACGCGHFLLKVYDLLKERFRDNLPQLRNLYGHLDYQVIDNSGETIFVKGSSYWQEENLHYHILRHCLFGSDIDEGAASLSLAALAAKGSFSFKMQANIICCDSLVRPENLSLPNFEFWARKYCYVVGNPPYVSFGLKDRGKLKKVASQYLRQNYPNSAEYKISYYALFLERFIELLAPGGKMGVITPDSFLIGRYFSKIRGFILKNCLINEFLLLNLSVFAANIGFPVISIFTKIDNNVAPSVQEQHLISAKKYLSNSSTLIYQYRQNYFEKQPYSRFRLFFSQIDKNIIDKMDTSSFTLSNFAQVKTGMRSLSTQKDIIKSPSCFLTATCKKGIISSAEVKPFFINYQGNWLDVDPSKLNPGGWDRKVIENEKIFIRQTGSSLIAAIDSEKLYHLNNVHSISLLPDAKVTLEYLLCIINSKLMNFYYRTVSLETGRSMAQTDIETLEKLPIIFSPQHLKILTVTTKKLKRGVYLYSTIKDKSLLRERLLLSSINHLQTLLNNTIYHIYRISAEEIKYLENIEI